jgi:hypothetical protein
MNELTVSELNEVKGGDNAAMIWGAQAASDGLHYATNSGGNLLVMGEGTLLAAAGGWVWAAGSFVDGIMSLFD